MDEKHKEWTPPAEEVRTCENCGQVKTCTASPNGKHWFCNECWDREVAGGW